MSLLRFRGRLRLLRGGYALYQQSGLTLQCGLFSVSWLARNRLSAAIPPLASLVVLL